MTHFDQILARRCWIFDLDGTLTLPVHDFAAIRAALGMAETDPDILRFLASLPAAEAAARHTRLIDIEYELAAMTAAASLGFNMFIFPLFYTSSKSTTTFPVKVRRTSKT